MSKYFTYLWKNDEWKRKVKDLDQNLIYAASNQFSERGVKVEDTLFIVTVLDGCLYLGGKIIIKQITNRSTAASLLSLNEADLWKASEYAIASLSSISIFQKNNLIEGVISHKLEFTDGRGFKNPKLKDGKLDVQTFRGVRELYDDSYKHLLSRCE